MTSVIVQYWLNDRLDPAVVREQMAALAAAGYQGVYPHARAGMSTPYFSDGWWAAIDVIVEACREHGLELWIWDEDYYPSGLAGGRIVWERPELRARSLDFSAERREGAGPFEADFTAGHLLGCWAIAADGGEVIDLTALCGTRRQAWGPRLIRHGAYSPLIADVGHPHWRAWMRDNRWAVIWTPPHAGAWTLVAATTRPTGGEHPDLLRPEGTQRFLELSHAAYLERYGAELGRTIRGVFTDEPSPGAGQFPWTDRFPTEFAADHGYDLLPLLPHLALDVDARSPVVRHHYRLTQHRLQAACYLGAIQQWCAAHGILSSGHLTRSEWLSVTAAWWPNELRCYRGLDVPAADPLGASVGFTDAAAYHTGLKVVSSAAHLFGKPQAGSDCLAIVGDEAGLRDLKYGLDWHLVLGINHFSLHGVSYSHVGPRKDEVPPSLFVQHPQFRYLNALLDYTRETAEALTGGRHICAIGVLYPSTSLACQLTAQPGLPNLPDEALVHGLVETLLSHQRDFDLIDEVTLDELVDAGGCGGDFDLIDGVTLDQVLDASGHWTGDEAIEVLILPYLRYLDARAAAAVVRFARAGGRVLAVGGLPLALPAGLAEPDADWHHGLVTVVDALDPGDLPGPTLTGEGARDVFVYQRVAEGEPRTFLFNRREDWFRGSLDGRTVTVPPRGSLLLHGDAPPPAEPTGPAIDLSTGWAVTFEPNQLPLSFWHVEARAAAEPSLAGRFDRPGYDLLRREADPAGEGDGLARYWCRFMLTGQVPDARLVLDLAACGGDWQLWVNDHLVTAWREEGVFDWANRVADVGEYLRRGTTPTLNVVRVDSAGAGRGLREVPYLVGSFAAEYRFGHVSYPFVTGAPEVMELPGLLPWETLGRPTFSGAATYRRRFTVEAGTWWLDLGRVEDLAAVRLDGGAPVVLAWPPYRTCLGPLTAGEHEVSVEVINPPANRVRVAHRPAGLLGPVRLIAE